MKNILIKFKSGEEIICEAEDNGDHFYIKNAASLLPMENQSWHLVTWMPYTTAYKGIKINKQDTIFIADLEEDMQKYYNKWKDILGGKKVNLEEK
jgi:hypothetical protein